MKKIVINRCHGGFSLSHEAIMMYSALAKLNLKAVQGEHFVLVGYSYYLDGIVEEQMFWTERQLFRDDPDLVFVVERLKEQANGRYAELEVVSIPSDVNWYIEEYDGLEWIAEKHRTWP